MNESDEDNYSEEQKVDYEDDASVCEADLRWVCWFQCNIKSIFLATWFKRQLKSYSTLRNTLASCQHKERYNAEANLVFTQLSSKACFVGGMARNNQGDVLKHYLPCIPEL